jgi:hypothetical protein
MVNIAIRLKAKESFRTAAMFFFFTGKELTPWNRVLHEKLIDVQLLMKLPFSQDPTICLYGLY